MAVASTPITATPESVGLISSRLDRVGKWIQHYVESGKLPGALVQVSRHGEVVFLSSVGYRDLEAVKPITIDTIFRIYSMTKPITSVGDESAGEQTRLSAPTPGMVAPRMK